MGAALAASCRSSPKDRGTGDVSRAEPAPKPILDLHVHLFGTGDGGSGCRLSPQITGGMFFKVLSLGLRAKSKAPTLDEAYVDVLLDDVEKSGLDRVVLLAQDGVYDSSGRYDESRTHAYVPNGHLFSVVSRRPARLIPCPSINPDRRDCLDELEKCLSRGARLLKMHPPIQGVDLEKKEHARFFARCAERDVIILVHTGHEHSSPVIDIRLADPAKLEPVLDAGCTVIACHAGTGWSRDVPDFLPRFIDMSRRHRKLYGDTSILGTATRVRDVQRLLEEKEVLSRLLHGSDYPFPSMPIAFAGRIGREAADRLQGVPNLLRRDLALKAAIGFGRESAEQAFRLVCAR